jgi:hypothetical protein
MIGITKNMILKDKITKQIKPRKNKIGLIEDGYFHIVFNDKSEAHERDFSWAEMSEHTIVDYMGQKRIVRLCKYPVKSIKIKHRDLITEIKPEKDTDRVYTSIRSIATNGHQNIILGRVVGVVRNGKVIEERFIGTDDIKGVKFNE